MTVCKKRRLISAVPSNGSTTAMLYQILKALPRICGNTGASAVTNNAYLARRSSDWRFSGASIAIGHNKSTRQPAKCRKRRLGREFLVEEAKQQTHANMRKRRIVARTFVA